MQETLELIKQAFDLKSQNCYKQAIEMFYKALETETDNIEILFQLGELYFLLNNFQRAEHYLEKVLSFNPKHVESLRIIEKIHIYSNDYTKAFSVAKDIFNIQKNEENLLNLIKIASKKGDLNKIEEFVDSELNNDLIFYEIAKAYYNNRKLKEAKDYLNKALELNFENEKALILLGKMYFDENEFDKSKEIFNSISKTSENPEVLNYLGVFSLEELRFTDAIKFFSKASNIDKKNSKYLFNLGNAYFYNGWIKESVTSYMQAICLAPENLDYRYSLAYLYYDRKFYDKAQKEIDYILENNPDYALAHTINALLKYEKKDYLGAKAELETNIKNKNDDNFTLVSIAKVYSELSMFDKAENALKIVLTRNPDSLNYKCQMAEILISEHQPDEALKLADEIISENENYISAYITAAKAFLLKKDIEKVKEYSQTAISLDMNYAEGYYYLAQARFEEKDYDEAIECMKRAITYDIENAEYYAKMSEIYQAKEDFKTALEYIKEAEDISGSADYRTRYQKLASANRKNLTKE